MTQSSLRNVKIEGLGLTADFLTTLADRTKARSLINPETYGLAPREPVEEAISRSWDRLRKAYARWGEAKARNGSQDALRYWIAPLLQELEHTDLKAHPELTVADKTYPITFLGTVPVHGVPGEDLDRISARGSVRASPHGLVQEYLNRSSDHLWGIVTNGEKLRLLRDNVQVTRPAYVQFDLEEMFDQGDSAGFRVLWLLTHRSRFEGRDQALIEEWNKFADTQGTRANEALRDGVAQAIEALGAGFVQRNRTLRERLSSGELKAQDLYRQCLGLVYQLVFLFVIEDRDLLHPDGADPLARQRYTYYSTKKLRQLAQSAEGSQQHGEAWEGLKVLLEGMYAGLPFIGVPAFGGHLFERHALLDLGLANADLYKALRALSLIEQDRTTKAVNFSGLDAEELGSIYESLLELHPEINTHTGTFTLATAAGNERKLAGAYYTPTGLIELLLESALDPVIEEALAKPDPVAALRALKVVDPACGSGHFLLAAARRIGLALARAEHHVTHPSPAQLREAVREVIAHCIYGVDINPMAIELCKVALWLESVTPGKPLTFLDHRLRSGNSLLGATPDLMVETTKRGSKFLRVPDEAFEPIEGDDKKYASAVKKQNKVERGQPTLESLVLLQTELVQAYAELNALPENDLTNSQEKERAYTALQSGPAYQYAKLIADAWCAAFVWPKKPGAPLPLTTDMLGRLAASPDHPSLAGVRAEVERLSEQYRFLHWHVEFPDASGGFDCVLGNPPWERIKLQEKEWFAERVPEIAAAKNAAERGRKIKALKEESPAIYEAFLRDLRRAEGESHFIRNSGRYPLTGRGDVNTYAVFSEGNRNLLSPTGTMGLIVPSGIATDDTYKYFFQDITDGGTLSELHFFNNKVYFKEVGLNQKLFCTFTISNSKDTSAGFQMSCDVSTIEEARDPGRRFTLSPEDIALLNPNTRTAPVFRSTCDAEITKGIYRRVPVLVNEASGENPWGIRFMAMFHMSNDSSLFRSREELEESGHTLRGNRFQHGSGMYLPLYEAKLMHQFDHRFATYTPDGNTRDMTSAEKASADALPLPRYWVSEEEVEDQLVQRDKNGRVVWEWARDWLMGFRDITNATNERTGIFSVEPRTAIGHTNPVFFMDADVVPQAAVLGSLNSFVMDYVARQKVGGTHLTYGFLRQFPVLPPSAFTPERLAFITPRVLELTYTAHDLAGFARDLGYEGLPFVWNDERRFWLRAELDALYFHLYGIDRDDVDYIMETFPIVKRKDEAQCGTYRTKNAILEIYDEIARVGLEGYRTRLEPGPADERAAHGTGVEV